MKPGVVTTDPKAVDMNRYVYLAGAVAGVFYGSYKRLTTNPAQVAGKPAVEPQLRARAAHA